MKHGGLVLHNWASDRRLPGQEALGRARRVVGCSHSNRLAQHARRLLGRLLAQHDLAAQVGWAARGAG